MTVPDASVSGAVEGIVDEAILRVLLASIGRSVATIYVQGGKARLLAKLQGFNNAAQFSPWAVIVDLNGDAPCAPDFVKTHLAAPATQMAFRVAVRQAESWLMGDRERLSRYLGVSQNGIPLAPELENDPKASMVAIARQSRRRQVREDMVPSISSGRKAGPNYAGRLIEFATQSWRPDVASQQVESLARCLSRLSAF